MGRKKAQIETIPNTSMMKARFFKSFLFRHLFFVDANFLWSQDDLLVIFTLLIYCGIKYYMAYITYNIVYA